MSSEPNHKIDGLLKRFVQKRREEARADFELHPATRKLLQGEVARTFQGEATESKPRILNMLWPRLVLAGAFTAVLVFTVTILNTPQKSRRGFQLADNKEEKALAAPAAAQSEMREENLARLDASADKKGYFKSATPAPAEVPVPEQLSAKDEVATVSGVELAAGKLGKQIETESAREPGQTGQLNTLTDSFGRSQAVGTSVEKSSLVTNGMGEKQISAVTRGAGSVPASAAVNFDDGSLAQNRWRFVQQDLRAKYRQNYLSPVQPAILQSFEVVQTGNKIQLVDRDGSVYEGEILGAEQDKLKENVQNKNEQASEFNFRVIGTNQRLNQFVTFTGNYAVMDANIFLGGKVSAKKLDSLQNDESKRKSGAVGYGFINGKVSIGGTNEFEIQATESPQ
jgi:hypothetical protein